MRNYKIVFFAFEGIVMSNSSGPVYPTMERLQDPIVSYFAGKLLSFEEHMKGCVPTRGCTEYAEQIVKHGGMCKVLTVDTCSDAMISAWAFTEKFYPDLFNGIATVDTDEHTGPYIAAYAFANKLKIKDIALVSNSLEARMSANKYGIGTYTLNDLNASTRMEVLK